MAAKQLLSEIRLNSGNPLEIEQKDSSNSLTDQHNYLDYDGVRISPRRMHFSNAVTRRIYEQILTIRNCSPHSVLVRIEPPSNTEALKIKTILKAKRMVPGFDIKLPVEYKYQENTSRCYYFIPIIINERQIQYKVVVTPLIAKVLVYPMDIDFGLFDMSLTVTRRTMTIRNVGTKPTRFIIDLGTNELKMRVDPAKGVVNADAEVVVSVEIMLSEEGDFHSKFYVRTSSLLQINVFGKVTIGKLEIINRLCTPSFTMVDFPRTYYGAKSIQHLILRNNCASRSIFCILFEGKLNSFDSLANAIKERPALKRFSVHPIDGRLDPRESRIITITYEPALYPSDRKEHTFDLAIMQIKKLSNCKDLNIADFPSGLYSPVKDINEDPTVLKSKSLSCSNSLGLSTIASGRLSDGASFNSSPDDEFLIIDPLADLSSTIDVCLHGEPEQAKVTVVPNMITIKDVMFNKFQDRVLYISNKSEELPITFSYVKVPGIDVKPKHGNLQANSSKELLISLIATKYGFINTQIKFELFICNHPFNDIGSEKNLIGSVSVTVKLSVKAVTKQADPKKPCHNDDVARVKSTSSIIVRTKTSFESRQIKLALPMKSSFEDYHFRREQKILNSLSMEFYQKFMKEDRLRQLALLRDDMISKSDRSHLRLYLIYRTFIELDDDTPRMSARAFDGFLPLTPMQINNIVIDPLHIVVGKVASYSRFEDSFNITNNNNNSIRVFLIPEKQRFTFPKGEAFFIEGQATEKIRFTFFAENEGYYNLGIRIIVNECHVFGVTLSVPVVGRSLNITRDHIKFKESDGQYKFFELYNNLNVPIEYEWFCSHTNFDIQPASARIQAKSRMRCLVHHDPFLQMSSDNSITLSVGFRFQTKIYISAPVQTPRFFFSSNHINFGSLGMNLPSRRFTTLWNTGRDKFMFAIKNPMSSVLRIIPESGPIEASACQVIELVYCTLNCKKFDITLSVFINGQTSIAKLHLTGVVQFPKLDIIPSIDHVNLPITSCEKITICITNKAASQVYLSIGGIFPISNTKDSQCMSTGNIMIDGHGNACFVLHITSSDVISYSFFAPIKINNILGPPSTYNVSVNTATYIKDCYMLHCPLTIPNQKFAVYLHTSAFTASTFDLKFYFTPFHRENNVLKNSTTFTNISKDTLKICIRVEKLSEHFNLSLRSTCDVVERAMSITFDLPPDGDITIEFEFLALGPGKFKCKLPFYVRNYYKDDVHNTLNLEAEYELPQLIAPDVVYFELVPLLMTCERTFPIKAMNHYLYCEVRCVTELYDIEVEIKPRNSSNSLTETILDVTLVFKSIICSEMTPIVTFKCDCGSTVDVACIGGCDNSLFTNYRMCVLYDHNDTASDATHNERTVYQASHKVSQYPYFPDKSDESSYEYFNKAVEVVELWLYSQAFFGRYMLRIPHSICRIILIPGKDIIPFRKSCHPRTAVEPHLIVPLVELLINLTSRKTIADFDLIRPIPDALSQRVTYLFTLYDDILTFLKNAAGAILPHVKPEYLLPYYFYENYKKYIENNIRQLHVSIEYEKEDRFLSLSKQCWLDVILQIIKLFVIQRVCPESWSSTYTSTSSTSGNNVSSVIKTPKCNRRKSLTDDSNICVQGLSLETLMNQIFTTQEICLLNWLETHFENQKQLLFRSGTTEVKAINNFDSAIRDSLAFAAATVAYCPYLIDYLDHLYMKPESSAEYHHNAASLIRALMAINCTFSLVPMDIYEPHPISMALLTHYLHELLPTLRPTTEINVTAALSRSSKIEVSITNTNNFRLFYRVVFFGPDRDCFSTATDEVMVKPQHTEMVTVKYHAKFLRRVTAILVLCGESSGNRSANSCAYTLIGNPDVTYVTSQFTFHLRENMLQNKDITIQAPYRKAASYDIFVSPKRPKTLETLELHTYEKVIKDRLPRKIFYPNSQVFFNESGQATIPLTVSCFALFTRTIWYFFRNSHIGDFCIMCQVVPIPTTTPQKMTMQIPEEAYKAVCTCSDSRSKFCKKNVILQLPKINEQFYNAFIQVFISVKGANEDFWLDYINKVSSVRHLDHNLVLKFNPEMYHIIRLLSDDRVFNVKLVNVDEMVTCDKTLAITEFYKRDLSKCIELSIHVGSQKLKQFRLELTCSELQDNRFYDVTVDNVRHYKGK